MERQEVEILLQEKLIKLLQTSISFDSRSNRTKTYSLLSSASKKRSIDETIKLIDDIDKQINSFALENIKNYFKENNSKLSIFQDEISDFISRIEKKVESSNSEVEVKKETIKDEDIDKLINYVDRATESVISEAKKNKESEEYQYFVDDNVNTNLTMDNKLTREEIDGFMRKIDDKLEELKTNEALLENEK